MIKKTMGAVRKEFKTLTMEEVAIVYELSKKKYEKVLKKSEKLYVALVKKLGLGIEDLAFLDTVESEMLRDVNVGRLDVFKRRLWEDGWMRIDPYFLLCFKPIFPLVYVKFLKKGTTTTQIKKCFSPSAINDSFKQIAGGILYQFLTIISNAGTEYYRTLSLEGLLHKFDRKEKIVGLKGLSKSIVYDILRYMRRVEKGDKNASKRKGS